MARNSGAHQADMARVFTDYFFGAEQLERLMNLPYGHPAWIEINLFQFKQNILAIKQLMGRTKLCLPVKANAYGHGTIPIAQAAVEAGIDYLAVSSLQEGALIKQAGIKIPILVMGAIHEEQIVDLLNYQLEISVSSRFKAEILAKKCLEMQKKCKVHLEIDTGMRRTGVSLGTTLDVLNYLDEMKCFEIVGIYSHLATADQPNNDIARAQIRDFQKFIDENVKNKSKNRMINCHIANSGGTCYYPESHMDMVRPGLLCFGYFTWQGTANLLPTIAPFLSVKAKVAYFKVVGENQGIGYGHVYQTSHQTRIVTVPVGYGDGYRRALSNKAQVIIRGKRYLIAGNVCMDQFMVDIDDGEAYVGDEVTLIGKQGTEEIALTEIAQLCDTIPYEILCGFNDRLPRFYIE